MKRLSKNKTIIIVAIILLFVIAVASVCVVVHINKTNNALFAKPLSATSKIGVSYKTVGIVQRTIPTVTKNEGLSRYPEYGQTLTKSVTETDADFTALKQAILDENAYLNSAPDGTISGDCTNYNAMDANGYLYLNGERVLDKNGNHRQLYKHTASQNMYFGNVSDDQLAVIKQIAIQPRQTGNYITGLYAPAGEVVKLTISAADLQNVDGFYVYVGATLANGQANNVWLERDFVRMPVIANKMPVNANVCKYNEDLQTYTCYFGSYLGGPIYIGSPVSKNAFQVEIEGAVEYPHLIYGLTTEKQYDDLLKSTAPYFDMEVFDNAFRFSGARTYSDNYTYAELCDSAVLWEKIALVSKQVPTGSNASYGIDFLFEPFVAAGAAVAFVGRNTVNCPLNWMDDCLNVSQFVNSGSWGNVHEFNHHFQNFGLPNGGEVTNNAISLVEYSLFTKISSNRSLDDNTLSGWNAYTDASRVLRMLLENSAKGDVVQSLDAYAMLLHSFGQDAFIQATKNGSGVDNWYKNLCEQTHYNLYYYFDELLHQTPSQDVANQIAQKGYPMYVPVASIYQTGTKYLYEGTQCHVTTMQPFEFLGDSYDFGILSNLHLPDGFTVTNVTVGNPQCGTIETLGNDSYRFVPNEKGISGDIDVTISLQKEDNAFQVQDVTLVFGFKQKQPTVAQRTSYYFDSDLSTIFEDIDDAVAKNYAGYTSKQTFDNTQGAQVWWDSEGVVANSITEYNCKIYLSKTDAYRFSIRGKNSNLYLSLDGVNYQLVARAGDVYNNKFDVSVQNGEYVDVQLEKGQTVYLRAVTMHFNTVFEGPSFVIGMGTVVDGASSLNNLSNSTAYNVNHQVEVFQTDYFYTRNYTADIVPPETDNTSTVISTNFSPWDDTTIVVGAGGLVTIDDVAAVYTTIDTNKIGVTLADGYKEITLNKANNTCTIAVPQVNVNYDLGGHGDNVTPPVNKMTTQTIADAPTAEGYVFRGWYTTAEFTTEAPATFVASADVTYYAKWDKAVTITYHYNDGGAHANTTDETYYANDKVTSLQAVDFTYGTKVFVGWFTQDGSTSGDWGTEFAVDTVITESIDLYAQWVEYSPFAGTYTMLRFYSTATSASDIWNNETQKLVIDAFGNGIVTSYNGFTNGYAVSISFVEGSTSVVTITAGSPSSTSRTSYYGVYDAASGVIVRASGSTGFDTTVYMMVPYNANYVKEDFAMFAWKDGSTYRKFISFADRNAETETTRAIFIESATNVAFGVTWSAKDKNYADVTDLASVSANAVMFTVTAGETTYSYAKNSSNSFVTVTDTVQGKYTNGDDYVVLSGAGAIYFKDGTSGSYTVAEDGTISALTSTANYTITLDTSAKTFTKADNKVTIKYYDGETELTDKQAAPYSGIKYTLIAGPEKTGYVFRGWYENADFSGSKVTSVTPTGDKTYYAKYDAAVTLTFDYNGYTDGETSSHSVTGKFVNDKVDTLPTVLNDAKYGTKVFAGWFTANGADGNWGDQVNTSTILTETTTTYYAKWIEPHAMMGTYKGAEVWSSTSSNASKNLTVTSLGVASGTQNGTITDYNAETGYFKLVNGSNTYYGYHDRVNDIVVISFTSSTESFGNDTYFYFKDATTLSLTSANVVSWNGNKTRIINFTVDGESKIIYINDTEVYCDVDVVDATGNSVAISSALKTAGTVITIKKGATSIVTYGYVGDTFVLSDGYQGTYTATGDGIGSIVLDGYGNATIGEAPVAYVCNGSNITVVYNNRMYVLSLDKTTFKYTQVQDGYQGEYTMPDGTTKIQLGGYGAVTETDGNGTVTETTKTYVVSGSNITIYDGETSTTYGIDKTTKTLLGKSIFAGLTFSGTYYDDYDKGYNSISFTFDDSSALSGKLIRGVYEVKFTATFDGSKLVITITENVAYASDWVGKTIEAALSGNTFTITKCWKTSGTYTFANEGSVTCPDFGA